MLLVLTCVSCLQVEYGYEDMTGANCALCLAILAPVIGIIIAVAILASAPRGSRRARMARIALIIGVFICVVWMSIYFSVLNASAYA